jgi:hypothetical protein
VAGLPDDWPAELTFTLGGASSAEVTDPRCDGSGTVYVCQVTGEAPDVGVTATFPRGGSVTVWVSTPQEWWSHIFNNLAHFTIWN